MLADCDVIEIFPIYGQFRAIQKLDSGRTVCKTYIFFKSNPLFYKNSKQSWDISNTALTLLLLLSLLKSAIFWKKNADIGKINKGLVLKCIFSETTFVCVLTYQISSFKLNSIEF